MDETQVGIKIARRNVNKLIYADGTTLMAENELEIKNLLMKMKEESGKAGLKLNIQKIKIMGIWSHYSTANRSRNNGNGETLFSWAPKSLQMVIAAMKLKDLVSWKKSYDKPRQHIKN